MCGGGSSGGSGGVTVGLLSLFLLVSFRWLLGEEVEELLELVTVSPELQATREACLLPNGTPGYARVYFLKRFLSLVKL